MKTIEFPYGKEKMPLHLEDGALKAIIECDSVECSTAEKTKCSEEGIIREALENPIGSPKLSELSKGKKKVLVITSDHTRPVPSHLTLPPMLEEIRRGSPDAQITVLIATGTHRPTTEAEMRAKFGGDFVDREHVVVHRCEEDPLVYKGKLPSGCELYVNALAGEAELIVADGFIEPHFFAGFSGGRKSVLPGITGRESVHENHCAMLIGDEHSRMGEIEDNVIHRDMLAGAKMTGLKFILNVVLREKKVVAAFAGDLEMAHDTGCEYSKKLFSKKAVPADIVFTSNGGYPLDQNLYQSVKSMVTAEACVNKGGVVVCVTKCSDGSGGESFVRWFTENGSAQKVMEVIGKIPSKETRADQWQAQLLARVMCRATVVVVSEEANRAMIESMGLEYCKTADEAYDIAKKILKNPDGVVVIPDGISVAIEK